VPNSQGCRIGSLGAKNQEFGSFEKQLVQNFYLAIWVLFGSFANFIVPQNFLGEE